MSYLHADAMWNFSNAVSGYKQTRTWNFVPFVGVGWARSYGNDTHDNEIGFDAGLLNVVRLCDLLDLTLEARCLLVNQRFDGVGGGRIGGDGLPYSVIITAVYALILGIVLAKTRIGRQIYACGSNLEAAKLSGINAVKTRMFAYCISGLSAAICGILVASRLSSAQPTAGNGYEMEAIAASVLGGISILGGEGTILNTIIGALMMGVIRNGLNLNGVNSFWQQVILGFILLIAVASQTASKGGQLEGIKRMLGLNKAK